MRSSSFTVCGMEVLPMPSFTIKIGSFIFEFFAILFWTTACFAGNVKTALASAISSSFPISYSVYVWLIRVVFKRRKLFARVIQIKFVIINNLECVIKYYAKLYIL